MPKAVEVDWDEVVEKRKDFVDKDGAIHKAMTSPASWNGETRSARFVMSVEDVDRHRDIVVQQGIDTEAFDKNPVALFGHRSYEMPIGEWSNLSMVRSSPKRTEGTLTFVESGIDDFADRVAAHVAAGTLKACSIGFRGKRVERIMDDEDNWTYGYRFLEIELYECSVVTIPAVREALAKGAAGVKEILAPEVIEEFLDHLKAHPAVAAMVPTNKYAEALRELTGNKTTVEVNIDPEAVADLRKRMDDFQGRIQFLEDPGSYEDKTKSNKPGMLSRWKEALGLIKPPVDPDRQKTLIARSKQIRADKAA